MKQRRQYAPKDQPQRITKAVTHIRLCGPNPGKLAALDTLASVYLALCQQYVTLFCTEEPPDKFHPPVFHPPLSERWHRVAIQQAAGIAQSWQTNREQAYQDYLEDVEEYQEQQAEGTLDPQVKEPEWREWDVPTLQQTCIYERLSVATMKHKARAMNAYMRASNLAHIPQQIAWNAAKRGRQATRVKSAYSSQACNMCYYTDKANRPDQRTFCCQVCGYSTHADLNAATNIERRVGDMELHACKDRKAIKALLMQRHEAWKKQNGWP